jgi:diaminohydroxyphosphoribosylaminopyrimidine deaminase/5-amino-6-(5-phosphoribosylamino)uracil reductase
MPLSKSPDEYFMNRAFTLAKRAEGKTSPNPMVGCLIVKGGRVIAEGYHKKAGLPHAEIEALKKIGFKAKGASLYVSLEPCCHWGKTAPCVDRLISSGVKKVVIAVKDPNPRVSGRSIARLRRAKVSVKVGVLAKEAQRLNQVFFINMKKKRPYVVAKFAQTLDGKIATGQGSSKWITSLASRRYARRLRGLYDAILVGRNTVTSDDPRLDCRAKRLTKVILDPDLKISPRARLFRKAKRVFIFTKSSASRKKKQAFKGKASLVALPYGHKGFDPNKILKSLYSYGVSSVFIEGGSLTLGRFFDQRLVDKTFVFVSPKIMGKRSAISPIGGSGEALIGKLAVLKDLSVERTGKDCLITGYPRFK